MGSGLDTARDTGPDRETDATLVALAMEGDREAFGLLVRRHLAVAYAVARPLVATDEDAEDVVQDSFIRALEHLEECREPDRFRAWLSSIVRNRAHNVRKYQRLRDTDGLDTVAAAAPDSPEDNLTRTEIRERAAAAAQRLTDLQRSVLVLHDYEGWKHSEIGERLGISEGGSRFHLHAARKKMRTLLDAPDAVGAQPTDRKRENDDE